MSQSSPKQSSSTNKGRINPLIIAAIVLFLLISCCGAAVVIGALGGNGDTEEKQEEPQSEEVKGEQKVLYKVVEVVDGDTIKIDYEGKTEKVRLIGIDTPESVHPEKPVECFALEAKNEMSELLENKEVYVEFDESQDQRDKYDRLLLYVWRQSDDVFVNDYMIKEGYAHEYTYNLPYKYQDQFKQAEKEAQENKKGLWGDACACENGKEKERKCIGCNKAEVTKTRWDCSTYTEEVEDTSCTDACPKEESSPPAASTEPAPTPTPTPSPAPSYVCDCSKTCSQMSSCDEAYYQLNTCGCLKRDGDNDGVPCENICPGG